MIKSSLLRIEIYKNPHQRSIPAGDRLDVFEIEPRAFQDTRIPHAAQVHLGGTGFVSFHSSTSTFYDLLKSEFSSTAIAPANSSHCQASFRGRFWRPSH